MISHLFLLHCLIFLLFVSRVTTTSSKLLGFSTDELIGRRPIIWYLLSLMKFEPVHEKTNNLHMRKQRLRSAMQ